MEADEQPNPAFVCPITGELFVNPVIAEDGHTYERIAITDWLRKNSISPLTRAQINPQNLKPNLVVKAMITEFKKFENEAKVLKESNAEFKNKFSTELKNVERNQLQEESYIKILSQLNIESFTCPLTKKIFENPVLASDGYTYERAAFENWIQKNDFSPVTKQKLLNKNLLSNHATKNMIDLFKQEEKEWKNVKEAEKTFLYVFAPKIRETLQFEIKNLEKNAAQKLLQNWGSNIELEKEKVEILKKQTQLNSYSLKENKNTFQVPNSVITFVGRQKELDTIGQILEKDKIVCIVGSGGMGKTQLATEYIKRSAHKTVIWLHGENKLLTFQIQTYMEKAHNQNVKNLKSEQQLFQKFYESLGFDALVVFDNVETQQFIKELIPSRHNIKIMITSRYSAWQFPIISLSQFTQNEMQMYMQNTLQTSLQNKVSAQDVITLHKLLGGLPLAISQAVACMQQDSDSNVLKYCQAFRKSQSESFQKATDDRLNSVYTTSILALHNVNKINNQVDLLLNVIGYISPDLLDKSLSLLFFESQDPKGFSKTKSKKLKQVYKTLCDHSVILQDLKNENIYSINRLTQSVIRMIHKKNGTFEKNFTSLADWFLSKLYYNESSPDDVARVTNLIPHCLTIVKIEDTGFYKKKHLLLRQIGYHQFYAKRNYIQSKNYFQEALQIAQKYHSEDVPIIVQIINDLGAANGSIGNYKQQLQLHLKALNMAEKSLGKNTPLTAQILTNLGDAYGHSGEFQKQLQTLLRAVKIKERFQHLGEANINLCPALIHLGTAYGNLGDHKKKKEVLLRALEISKKHNGKNHHQITIIRMNLINANRNLGQDTNSIEVLSKQLQKIRKTLGKQHLDYALMAKNLGVSYMKADNYQKALDLYNESFKIYQKHLGPDNPNLASLLINIRAVYLCMNENNKAKQAESRAFQIMINYYGPNHPQIKRLEENLFKTEDTKNIENFFLDWTSAFDQEKRQKMITDEKFFQQATQAYTKQLFNGTNYQQQNNCMDFILSASKNTNTKKGPLINSTIKFDMLYIKGQNFLHMGKSQQASKILQQALAINVQLHGENHIDNAAVLTDLGSAYIQCARYERAEKILLRALQINEKQRGPNHFMTGIALTNLGVAYQGLKDMQRFKQMSERAYTIFLKNNGPNNQWTRDALFNLQLATKQIAKTQSRKAQVLQRQMKKLKKPAEGEDLQFSLHNPQIVRRLFKCYGEKLISMYGLEKIFELDKIQVELESNLKQKGQNSQEVLLLTVQLAQCHNSMGMIEERIQEMKKALKISEVVKGKNDWFTIQLRTIIDKSKQMYKKEAIGNNTKHTYTGSNFSFSCVINQK